MSIDMNTLPVSPVFVLAAAGYAAVSVFVTGPEIAAREMDRSDWQATCQTTLVQELETTRAPEAVIPEVPNVGGLLCTFAPEFRDLCALIPDPNVYAREAERRLQAAETARIAAAASHVGDQCKCAQQVYLDTERLSLALYAASGRLISPKPVTDRDAALTKALRSPVCTSLAGS